MPRHYSAFDRPSLRADKQSSFACGEGGKEEEISLSTARAGAVRPVFNQVLRVCFWNTHTVHTCTAPITYCCRRTRLGRGLPRPRRAT